MEGDTPEDPTLFPATVGEKLRAAREAQGLELSEIAARTRIPQRHLEAIELGNFSGLPSITYAIGFAKSYARAVEMDEVAIARELRGELNITPDRSAPIPAYQTDDASRVPPSWLAWAGGIVALLVLVGVVLWYGTNLLRGSAPPPETITLAEGTSAGAPGDTLPGNTAAPVAAGGQVSLIALDKVWIRVTDATGERLVEKELGAGERYDVPLGADRPKLRTAGPEKLQVTINGSNVDPLGRPGQSVDVEVDAAALQARGRPEATPSPSPAASPRADASPAPAARRSARPTPRATPSAAPVETPPGNAAANP